MIMSSILPNEQDRDEAQADALRIPAVRPGYYSGENYVACESLGYLMKQVVAAVSGALEARMSEYGLTDAQWRPLLILSQEPAATATLLARSMNCDAGATTRMLDRLEDKGLLRRVRSADDRRVQQIELTAEGRKVAAIVPFVLADVLNAHLAELTKAEVDQLKSLLRRILATGRREAGSADAKEPTT